MLKRYISSTAVVYPLMDVLRLYDVAFFHILFGLFSGDDPVMVLLIVRKSHVNHLVSCRVLHLPAVGFGSRAVLGIVLRKSQRLAAFGLEVQDKEIGIPSWVTPMCL